MGCLGPSCISKQRWRQAVRRLSTAQGHTIDCATVAAISRIETFESRVTAHQRPVLVTSELLACWSGHAGALIAHTRPSPKKLRVKPCVRRLLLKC